MLPLYDTIPSRRFPIINWLMIVLCGIAFYFQLQGQQHAPEGRDPVVETYGMIPARVLHPQRRVVVREELLIRGEFGPQRIERERVLQPLTFSPWWTLLTCVFLHGGWAHIIGNLWFLHIFGDNVEDCFGHLGFLIFYLACGVAASAVHLLTNTGSTIPTIGASGAIAGVMGAYLVLYPRSQVVTLLPIFIFLQIITVPAVLFLGLWFAMQFFSGVSSLGATLSGGVAWWAHIGGFLAGMLLAWQLKQQHAVTPHAARRYPDTDRFRVHRVRPW